MEKKEKAESNTRDKEAETAGRFRLVSSVAAGLALEPDYIVEGLLESGEQLLLYGQPKVGKSFFAIQLGMAVALGRPFLKWAITKPRRVLYINFEIGERVFVQRLIRYLEPPDGKCRDKAAHYDNQLAGNFAFSVRPRSLNIAEGFGKDHLHAEIARYRPDLVVIDTLSKIHGHDERENNQIQRVLIRIREACEVDQKPVAHVIVHHARKGGIGLDDKSKNVTASEIRGGSAIRGEADVIVGLVREKGGAGGGAVHTLKFEARNVFIEDFELSFNDDLIFRVSDVQTLKERKDRFYELIKAPEGIDRQKLTKQLMEEFHVGKSAVQKDITGWIKHDQKIGKRKHLRADSDNKKGKPLTSGEDPKSQEKADGRKVSLFFKTEK